MFQHCSELISRQKMFHHGTKLISRLKLFFISDDDHGMELISR